MSTSKRFLGEVVELSRDCELGQKSDRAIVTALDYRYMTLTFPERAPDLRVVYTGADYKFLRTYEGEVEGSVAKRVSAVSANDSSSNTVPAARTAMERRAALSALRALVATYLESSNAAPRAAELLDALEVPAVVPEQEARERAMFGFPAAAIDEVLSSKTPRDIAMYAISALSNAQELICRDGDEPFAWSVRRADANTIRQIINIAKYAIDKAVPRCL